MSDYEKLNECVAALLSLVGELEERNKVLEKREWARLDGESFYEGRIRELENNSAFFRSCALSGEIPEADSEPYPLEPSE